MRLTPSAARALLLAAQGLLTPPRRRARKEDVAAAIMRMGALQIDTISVVARSPYLVLWSRLGAYEPQWLDALLKERRIFEYWAHEACFLPMQDFPLYRRLMIEHRRGYGGTHRWAGANADAVARVRATLAAEGLLGAKRFVRTDGESGGWWNWKDEKRALEHLYNIGEALIAERRGFHRIYGLSTHVMPDWDDDGVPPYDAVRRALSLKAVRALGIAKARWVPDYFRLEKPGNLALIAGLAREGALIPVEVEGWKEPAYVHPDHRPLLDEAAAGRLKPHATTLLSPFDPVIWDRGRARTLFGFDYALECYTPAPKRQWGYFTLPILYRGALIGRLDPKLHRREGGLEVKALYLEAGVRLRDRLIAETAAALARFAHWQGAEEIVIRRSEPKDFGAALTAALKEEVS